MKYVVVSIRDRVADVYGVPVCSGSVGQAIRSFSDEVNRAAEDNMFYKHCDDFDLFELGTFNDQDATYELHPQPRQLILGRECRSIAMTAADQPRLKGV